MPYTFTCMIYQDLQTCLQVVELHIFIAEYFGINNACSEKLKLGISNRPKKTMHLLKIPQTVQTQLFSINRQSKF